MADEYYGYKVRKPYEEEVSYFQKNPHVSGMATEDGAIIFNPYSQNIDRDSVGKNEAARLWMRENNVDPLFDMTPQQLQYFRGTPYENNPIAMKHTLLGRILSGDPTAGDVTPEQTRWAEWLKTQLKGRN